MKIISTMKDSAAIDVRLIPEFDGSNYGVSEWLEKLELVCELSGVNDVASVAALRLVGGAFAVYQQLSSADRKEYATIKSALLSAFALDKYQAYEQFVSRKLREGEAVDVYMADLRRMAGLFGGMSDDGLACAFVAGLPEAVRRSMRAGTRLEQMTVSELLARARAVMADTDTGIVAAAVPSGRPGLSTVPDERGVTC